MIEVTTNKFEEELIKKGDRRGAFESMFSRFNRIVQVSGVFREAKEHERYEKPCDKRNRKLREAKLRILRKERKDALHQKTTKGYSGRKNKQSTARIEGRGRAEQR